ncbi:unnamed protein product [Symbiodinium microadriaticum]|nr:unnamed protein product [Symbiodinium microadriaticum]
MTRDRFLHLQGVRFLCATWVLCGRFLPDAHAGFWLFGKRRLNVAADIFAVLSGFVSGLQAPGYDEASADASAEEWSRLGRRMLRILPALWLSMLWSLLFVRPWPPLKALQCALLAEIWGEEAIRCPVGAAWFLTALVPCWTIFPLVSSGFRRSGSFALCAAVLWLAITCLGQILPNRHFLPLAALPDFCLGAAAARYVEAPEETLGEKVEARPDSTGRVPWSLLADASAAIIVSLVTFVPASFRNAWDEAELFREASGFDHFLAPLIASFLLCSSQGGGKGAVQTVLRHQSMASLGHYSLYVYLFQEPLFRSIEAFVPDLEDSAEGFVFFVLCLWLISGLYAEKVEPMLLKISVSSASSDSEPTESTS